MNIVIKEYKHNMFRQENFQGLKIYQTILYYN